MIENRSIRLSLVAIAATFLPLAESGAQVAFERAGFRLTSIGERITVSGRVVDARRRPVAATSIRWRVADPSVATVTREGVLVSRKVGNTKLWAVAGDDSASALIVVDQWAAKFDFLPPTVRLDAVGAKAPLRIIVRDAGGNPIASQNRRPASCRSLNETIARLEPNGEVLARANGVTYVRCADRGVADSVRIEVRQRPIRVVINDKSNFSNRVVGDTFRIRITATDRAGDEVRNLQATWASLNPTIVTIDPLTGFARGIGPGTAKVVAQAGDVTDTVSVGVAPAVGVAIPENPDLNEALTPRMPTIRVEPAYPIVGDTVVPRFVVRDAAGVEIPSAAVTLEAADTSLFNVLSRGRVATKKEGTGYVLVRFGATVDSGQIVVRPRAMVTTASSAALDTGITFVRPTFDTLTLSRQYQKSRDSINSLIFDSTRVLGLKTPWFLVSASITGGQAMHSFSDSTGTEQRSGFAYGGLAEMRLLRYVRLGGEFRTGTLTASGATGTDLAVTEAGGSLAFVAGDVFAVGGSYALRATREGPSNAFLARQQWTIPKVFVNIRPAFVGGAVRTSMGVSALLPGATYTGLIDAAGNQLNPQPLSVGVDAGLEWSTDRFRIGLAYNTESFRFAKVGNSARRDQFSIVRVVVGLKYDR